MKSLRKFIIENTHSDGSISPYREGDEVIHSDGKKYTVTLEKHPNYVIIGTNNRQKTAKHSELS